MNFLYQITSHFVLTLVLTVREVLGVCFTWIITMITPRTFIPIGVYYSKGEGEDEKQGCGCSGGECQC